MINYQARNCSLTDIADHMRRDDLVGALARARTAFRGGRINAFDLTEVFFAVANADVNDAINRVRRLGGSSMRRSYVARSSPDVSWIGTPSTRPALKSATRASCLQHTP